ncbi:Ger(x)C family spore germination protein [Paenibacillus luteus]|uniref:Ger(x)C family spore germination protein n=1 Tax=Paenibacillus luteus TaxID=2545753 RepID=UPI0019D5E31D|nr:Ger(x)C family spore germination protein [Paenibacillus luteus]
MRTACRYGAYRRARKRLAFAGLVIASLLLQGCWDEVNLQDVSYISALGIDYKEDHYEVYAQMIKFALIAKTESLQPDPNPVWNGRGKGDSILLALNDLTQAGHTLLSLEHLKTVLVQERAMSRMNDIMDGINRQRASRYTSLLYGTRAPIEKIFTTDTFFDQSPLNSIMYMPSPLDSQRSFIRPYELQLVMQTLKEPAMVTTLPSLNANESYWTRKKQPLQIQFIDGIFVFHELRYAGYLTEADAAGLRWVNPEFKHFLIKAEGPAGKSTIGIVASRPRLQTSFVNGKPVFTLHLKMAGDISEMAGRMNADEVVTSVESQVKEQIEDTYRKGLAKKMDLFLLEHQLYRYHLKYWKEACKGKIWLPQAEQLKTEVHFQLIHSGNFDLNTDT